VGLDVRAIGSSSLFGFCSGRRFSIWLFVFNFQLLNQNPAAVIPAEGMLFSHHRQYSTSKRNSILCCSFALKQCLETKEPKVQDSTKKEEKHPLTYST